MNNYQPPTHLDALRAMGWRARITTIVFGVLMVIAAISVPLYLIVIIATDYDAWDGLFAAVTTVALCSAIFSDDYWRHRARIAEQHIADSERETAIAPDGTLLDGDATTASSSGI